MNPFLATEKEVWKSLPEHESLYSISNLGRVKSIRANKVLSTKSLSSGYPCFSICFNGKQLTKRVHQAVGECFLNHSRYSGKVINHKDGNKLNCRESNLEVVSQKENNAHALETGLRKKKASPVSQYTSEGVWIRDFSSQKEAQTVTGICRKQINSCLKKKQNVAQSYIWKYKLNT